MCTMIVENADIFGSGKGAQGWFPLRQINVSYDHPNHIPLENALSIDFVNPERGLSSRVAVELSPKSAKRLVDKILIVLARGESVDHGISDAASITINSNL